MYQLITLRFLDLLPSILSCIFWNS